MINKQDIPESNEPRVYAKTPSGTRLEVIGKHLDREGNVMFYDVLKEKSVTKFQITPKDLIFEGVV